MKRSTWLGPVAWMFGLAAFIIATVQLSEWWVHFRTTLPVLIP